MRYLLETSLLVSLLKGDPRTVSAVRRLERHGLAAAFVSLAELYFGAMLSSQPQQRRGTVDRLRRRLTVLPLDDETCHIFGAEAARLAAEGVAVPATDLAIAATCLRHGLTLLTADKRQYEQIPGVNVLVAAN